MIFRRHLAFLAVALAACTEPQAGDPPARSSADTIDLHRIETFSFIGENTTIPQVFAFLGEPAADIGSGIHIYEYHLQDGSSVVIGSPDGFDIWYVYHGDNVLFRNNDAASQQD